MAFVYVGKETMQLPSSYCLFQGGMDEVGLENFALHHPQCAGHKNIVLFNFSVDNALKYSFPACDCMPTKAYVVFKEEDKIIEFMSRVWTQYKQCVKRVDNSLVHLNFPPTLQVNSFTGCEVPL